MVVTLSYREEFCLQNRELKLKFLQTKLTLEKYLSFYLSKNEKHMHRVEKHTYNTEIQINPCRTYSYSFHSSEIIISNTNQCQLYDKLDFINIKNIQNSQTIIITIPISLFLTSIKTSPKTRNKNFR